MSQPPAQPLHAWEKQQYTAIPNEMFDFCMARITPHEFVVLAYLSRRTFGFHRDSTWISFSQICTGLVTKDGRRLDEGTGLSKSTVKRAIAELEKKGLIFVRRHEKVNGVAIANTYTLAVKDDGAPDGVVLVDQLPALDSTRGGFTLTPPPQAGRVSVNPPWVQREPTYIRNRNKGGKKAPYSPPDENGNESQSKKGPRPESCGLCHGSGIIMSGVAGPFTGTLDAIREALIWGAVLCDCDVGAAWGLLLQDAELPMIRKGAGKS